MYVCAWIKRFTFSSKKYFGVTLSTHVSTHEKRDNIYSIFLYLHSSQFSPIDTFCSVANMALKHSILIIKQAYRNVQGPYQAAIDFTQNIWFHN